MVSIHSYPESAALWDKGKMSEKLPLILHSPGSPGSLVISDVYHQNKINIPGILF